MKSIFFSVLAAAALATAAVCGARAAEAPPAPGVAAASGPHGGIVAGCAALPWDKLPATTAGKTPRDLAAMVMDTITEVSKHPPFDADKHMSEAEVQRQAGAVKKEVESALKADLKKYPGALVTVTFIVDNTVPADQVDELTDFTWPGPIYTVISSTSGSTRQPGSPLGSLSGIPEAGAAPEARYVVSGALVLGDMRYMPSEEREIMYINRTYQHDMALVRSGAASRDSGLNEQDVTKTHDEALIQQMRRLLRRYPRVALLMDAPDAANWKLGDKQTVTALIREVVVSDPWAKYTFSRRYLFMEYGPSIANGSGLDAGWLQLVGRVPPPAAAHAAPPAKPH
jgi:hypothetical protein